MTGLISHAPQYLKRVLFYFPDYGPMGGIERFICHVTQRLRERKNFEPVIVCSLNTTFYQRVQQEGFQEGTNLFGIQTFPIVKRLRLRTVDMLTTAQLYRVLRVVQPDLVHVHVIHIENLIFKMLGYPVVCSFHGYGSFYSLTPARHTIQRAVKKIVRRAFHYMATRVDRLIFVSQSEFHRMRDEGFLPTEAPIEVIPNGLPICEIRQSVAQINHKKLKEYFGVPEGSKIISFISRMDENKNPLLFIKLAECLGKEFDNVHFLLAGTGPLTEAVRNRIQASPIRNQFQFLGYQDNSYQLLAVSDLTVNISQMEGFSMVLLEAITVGTPILAFATGGILEIFPQPDWEDLVVPQGHLETLAKKAQRLLHLNDREKSILSNRLKSHAEQFDLSFTIERIEDTYSQILEKSTFLTK